LPRLTPTLSRSFSFTSPPPPDSYTLSLHDALPIFFNVLGAGQGLKLYLCSHLFMTLNASVVLGLAFMFGCFNMKPAAATILALRSEEHTSELQSLRHLVCRLLLEKKKNNQHTCRLQ